MILVEAWLASSLLLGACWALMGLLLGESTETSSGVAPEKEADGEAA